MHGFPGLRGGVRIAERKDSESGEQSAAGKIISGRQRRQNRRDECGNRGDRPGPGGIGNNGGVLSVLFGEKARHQKGRGIRARDVGAVQAPLIAQAGRPAGPDHQLEQVPKQNDLVGRLVRDHHGRVRRKDGHRELRRRAGIHVGLLLRDTRGVRNDSDAGGKDVNPQRYGRAGVEGSEVAGDLAAEIYRRALRGQREDVTHRGRQDIRHQNVVCRGGSGIGYGDEIVKLLVHRHRIRGGPRADGNIHPASPRADGREDRSRKEQRGSQHGAAHLEILQPQHIRPVHQ